MGHAVPSAGSRDKRRVDQFVSDFRRVGFYLMARGCMSDLELLREYVRTQSQDAFSELVRRHIDWVHSSALRQVRDRHLAEDVTQAVFILLAQKAHKLTDQTVLSGWLFRGVRYAAANALRAARRRKYHERAAAMMKSELSAAEAHWEQMAPLLDRCVARLGRAERQVVLLRFYEQKRFAEVAQTLGISEVAAGKRAERAVKRLREMRSN